MVTGQAGGVLRQLKRLLGTGGLDGLNDGQLLERFTARGDEAAFTALVGRHGPMVLGVCHRLLRGGADADDAFQATFLVLFRRARTLERRASLAGYLYTVAYHAALRARAEAARRRGQERQVADMPRADRRAEEVWRDLQPVLDDELNRLPDKYRDPVLLCYVEGKTNEEAARLLRLPTGTVKSRLSRARDLLKGRLARRGVTLSAGLLAAVLAEKASAAVPSRLVATTLQTTLLLAAGRATGAAAPAAALAEGVLKAMFATRLKIATAVLLAAGALAVGLGLGASARPALAQLQAEAAAPADPPPAAAPQKKAAAPEEKKEIEITGRVRALDGKPVAGARLAAISRVLLRFSTWEKEVFDRTERLGRTTSDADGRFRFTVPQPPPGAWRTLRVVAQAPGHGLGWALINPDAAKADAEVRLLPEATVAGRVVSLAGGPVAGLKIYADRLTRKAGDPDTLPLPKDDLIRHPPSWLLANIHSDTLPLPDDELTATTDEQGRFTFHGVGRGLDVRLQIDDRRVPPKEITVNTGDRKKAEGLVLALPPGQVIEGHVLYEDTGKPVAHAHLEVGSYSKSEEGYTTGGGTVDGRSDAQGRFRISMVPGSTGYVIAYPPDGQPYLVNSTGFEWTKGTVKKEVEVKVPRGVLLHGKVAEAPSGKPVAGASVEFQAPRDDAVKRKHSGGWRGRTLTAADGSYALAVPPGLIHILVTGPTPDYIAEPVGSAELEIAKPGGDPLYYHAAAALDLKEGEKPKEISFTLRRGVTLKGTAVTPDGKPVEKGVLLVGGFRPAWEKALSPIKLWGHGQWQLRGCDPERTYHLLFLACPDYGGPMLTAEGIGSTGRLLLPALIGPKNKLGATVEVSAKKAGDKPIEVRLQPTGSARLHLVDGQGKPVPNASPSLELVVSPGPTFAEALKKGALAGETIYLAGTFGEAIKAAPGDPPGTVTVEGLIPGATYRLRQFQQAKIDKDFRAESGQKIDVDVPVK
jgi:RNA polymerase sigma factor (sigma-70 family)